MRRVVVLGGGLTGLSAALHLAAGGADAVVLEREAAPGGACRTLREGPFFFDLTGHLLHLSRDDSRTLLADVGALPAFVSHRRRAGIALAGTITPYPIQIHTHRLPRAVRRDCVLGEEVPGEALADAAEPASFADWVARRFGEGFARHFFLPYNGKLFRTDPAELTTEWVGRYVPRPHLADVIDGAFGLYRKPVGYNAAFLYPRRGGISVLADTLAARCGGLRTGCEAIRVNLAAREVELAGGEVVGWDDLVATVALGHLAALTEDLPAEARRAAATLRSVGVVNLNLAVRGPAPRREHWLYVPEERYPFYRVGFPSNHGAVAPAGFHTVSVEVSVPSGEAAPAGLEARCLDGLEDLGLLRDRREVEASVTARLDPAYVVFDRARAAAVATLRQAYRERGVLLAGRWAEWKYSTMEDALWDGATVARRLTR